MSNSQVNVIVMGAMGRMGQMILSCCSQNRGVNVIGAVEVPGSPFTGQATGISGIKVLVTDSLKSVLQAGAVVINFTNPKSTYEAIDICHQHGAKMVIGTTGLSEVELTKIKEKAEEVPLVFSPNMSVGVNLMFKIAQLVSSTLGMEFDAEIIELHHNKKKDAPSGTALALAQAVADGRQQDLNTIVNYGRRGLTGERPVGQLGIHAVRGGDIVGEHSVIFAGPNERIELKHIAQNRALFAEGAVRAAIFLENKAMGFYSMLDVLGLSD